MASDIHGIIDDDFELERIAVGPYCVLDNFRNSPTPQPSCPPTAPAHTTLPDMGDPIMTADDPFAHMRASWLPRQHDDMSTWNDWMQFDPAQPSPDLPPGSVSNDQVLQPASTSPTASIYPPAQTVPFSYEQSPAMLPAFQFTTNPLTSPLTSHAPQDATFFAPSAWPQQPLHQAASDVLFSPVAYPPLSHNLPPSPPSTAAISPPHSSTPPSLGHGSSASSQSSPEPVSAPKKRKSRSEDDEPELESQGRRSKGLGPKKSAHNMIEKRYRTNLNDKIAALRDSVPSLRVMSRTDGNEEVDDPEDLEGLTPAHKLNKATVLSKATEYIHHLEKRLKRMEEEKSALQGEKVSLESRLCDFENIASSRPVDLQAGQVAAVDNTGYSEDPFLPQHPMLLHRPAKGMIPIPEDIAALRRGLPPQQHYAHAYPQYSNTGPSAIRPPMVTGRRGNAMMGKLMVGSLAGLMVLEGFAENEQSHGVSADHGLFALPVSLGNAILPRSILGASTSQIPLAKFLLVMCALFYLLAPLAETKKHPKKAAPPPVRLSAVPSLASPVEVRRKAWLTAIQTVWVPETNFMLEVAALGLKTIKLTMRKLIGWPAYSLLTGITKEQEAARIKAWETALDAQFTGGDADIDKSRLLLTLLASGTLPDTPARLMLKALHIRVLLWEIARPGHDPWWVLDDLSAKMARSYWNMARTEHRIAANRASKQDPHANPLPKHLASLIEKECDDVLVPAIVQRVYNLAWNKSSAKNTFVDLLMDGVVEDSAICSPLDALAAWYSSLMLRKGLASTLAAKKASPKTSVVADIDFAIVSAPPNSQVQLRALATRAVLSNDSRESCITSALQALPTAPSASPSGFANFAGDCSVAVDVRQALTMAKCLSLLGSSSPAARQRAVSVVNNTRLLEHTTSLLSVVAAHEILVQCMQDVSLQQDTSGGLENIASSLRMWVGHDVGKQSGLSNKIRSKIIENCLTASKTLVGLSQGKGEAEIDDGYVSSSVKDD